MPHLVEIGGLGVMEITSPGVGGRPSLPLKGGDVDTTVLAVVETERSSRCGRGEGRPS